VPHGDSIIPLVRLEPSASISGQRVLLSPINGGYGTGLNSFPVASPIRSLTELSA
jgi:hypothetical protein